MADGVPNPVVHLELRSGDPARALAFFEQLFGWRAEIARTGSGEYLSLALGDGIRGGIVEHDARRSFWLPYVEVADVFEATERASRLGASVCLPPREGPAGSRSVLLTPGGGMLALWKPKP